MTIVTDAARGEGIQRVTFQQMGTSGHETVEEIGGVGYFTGDAFTLENFNGFTAEAAQQYSGKWLKVTNSDAAFEKVTSGLSISSIPAQMVLPRSELLAHSTTIGGYSVKELRAVFKEPTGTVTGLLYIRSRGTPLPVEQTFTQQNGSRGTDTFGHWNEPVSVTPPTSSIPFSANGQ